MAATSSRLSCPSLLLSLFAVGALASRAFEQQDEPQRSSISWGYQSLNIHKPHARAVELLQKGIKEVAKIHSKNAIRSVNYSTPSSDTPTNPCHQTSNSDMQTYSNLLKSCNVMEMDISISSQRTQFCSCFQPSLAQMFSSDQMQGLKDCGSLGFFDMMCSNASFGVCLDKMFTSSPSNKALDLCDSCSSTVFLQVYPVLEYMFVTPESQLLLNMIQNCNKCALSAQIQSALSPVSSATLTDRAQALCSPCGMKVR
eukprot:767039-Hanusia_phi.AAC.5